MTGCPRFKCRTDPDFPRKPLDLLRVIAKIGLRIPWSRAHELGIAKGVRCGQEVLTVAADATSGVDRGVIKNIELNAASSHVVLAVVIFERIGRVDPTVRRLGNFDAWRRGVEQRGWRIDVLFGVVKIERSANPVAAIVKSERKDTNFIAVVVKGRVATTIGAIHANAPLTLRSEAATEIHM
ncbi:hypothetical protein D9M72_569390 [compost metagenome]